MKITTKNRIRTKSLYFFDVKRECGKRKLIKFNVLISNWFNQSILLGKTKETEKGEQKETEWKKIYKIKFNWQRNLCIFTIALPPILT